MVAGLLIIPPVFPTNNPVPVFPYTPLLVKVPVDVIELQLLPGPPIILPEPLLVIPFAVTEPVTTTVPLFIKEPLITVFPPRTNVAPLLTVTFPETVRFPLFTKAIPEFIVKLFKLIVPVGPLVKDVPELKFILFVLRNVPLLIIVQFPL